jgi:hypothetical protein
MCHHDGIQQRIYSDSPSRSGAIQAAPGTGQATRCATRFHRSVRAQAGVGGYSVDGVGGTMITISLMVAAILAYGIGKAISSPRSARRADWFERTMEAYDVR